jgi:hypothetical protein
MEIPYKKIIKKNKEVVDVLKEKTEDVIHNRTNYINTVSHSFVDIVDKTYKTSRKFFDMK